MPDDTRIDQIVDPDYPRDITEEEAAAGFSLHPINPAMARFCGKAVILVVGERHRLLKYRLVMSGAIRYSLQRKESFPGVGERFAQVSDFPDLKGALGWAHLHDGLDTP